MAENKKPGSGLDEARKQIRERIAAAEEAAKHARQKGRLEVAAKGANAYAAKNLGDAARQFMSYIKILEDMKGVPPGGLSPAHFDKKDNISELMLISGVYWELTKLYDRTTSAEKQAEFKRYLGKYIQFAKGMPYQNMCAEHLRRYLKAGQAMHKAEFKHAYGLIAASKCFVATELVEYVEGETLVDLRKFRDEILKQNGVGRKFVAWYYRNGPTLAKYVSQWPRPAKRMAGKILDRLSTFLAAF
jgi:hypothetical protein